MGRTAPVQASQVQAMSSDSRPSASTQDSPRQPLDQPIHAARSADDRQFVTALARGLEVLRCFSAERPELGSREIARSIGLSQPTVWRLCYTLSQLGYLVPGATPGKLRVGAPALALGAASLEALRFTQIIEPHLRAYIGRHPAAVVLAQRHQMTMLYLMRCEGEAHFIMKHPAGASVPLLQTALGWTCLAGMPEPMFERIAAEIEATTPRRLHAVRRHVMDARAQIAECGFVTSIGVDQPSIHYVSVPLLSPDGSEAYALLCGGPAYELTPGLLTQVLGPKLVQLGQQVRAALPGADGLQRRPA
jgi:DNA-binding IclR family transcriptional regulator